MTNGYEEIYIVCKINSDGKETPLACYHKKEDAFDALTEKYSDISDIVIYRAKAFENLEAAKADNTLPDMIFNRKGKFYK